MIITDAYIQSHRHAFSEVPDLERCLHVLQVWQRDQPNTNPYKFMNAYMVSGQAQDWVGQNILPSITGESKAVQTDIKPEKRKEKYARLERLALDNLYKEFTTQELVDVSGLSSQTLVTWIRVNGYFRAMKRGMWEARNPKDDRKA